MNKSVFRNEMLSVRRSKPQDEVISMSGQIMERLAGLELFRGAGVIMFYMSMPGEVQTVPLIETTIAAGKLVCIPRAVKEGRELIPCRITDLDRDVAPAAYGILEPIPGKTEEIPVDAIDLVIVPGVAFDASGNRLGHGGGYYDRFLPRLRPGAGTVAVAFEWQITDKVPVEEFDFKVEVIVTESRVIDCRAR